MVYQNSKHNNGNIDKTAPNNIYDCILFCTRNEPLSPKEIRGKVIAKGLRKDVSLPAVKKWLYKLVKDRKIVTLERINNRTSLEQDCHRNLKLNKPDQVLGTIRLDYYDNFLKEAYGKDANPNVDRYYVSTPKSARLFEKLRSRTIGIANADLLVEDILTSFQIMESMYRQDNYYFLNEKMIKKQIKASGMRLTKEIIQETRKTDKAVIDEFQNNELNYSDIDIPGFIFNTRESIDIGSFKLTKTSFMKFLNAIYSEMTPIMRFSRNTPGLKEEFNIIVEKTASLNFLIIKEATGYKVFNDFC